MIVPQQPSWQLAVSRRLGLVCASLALIVLVAQASPPSEVSDASEQLEEWVPSCHPFCGMEVVVHKGYGLERHYATTPDGYILGLFRLLPRGEKSAARLARSPPLVLQHALLDSSFAWVSNYHKNQSLALLASDAGYDVWLGNNRGPPRLPSLRLPSPPPRCAFPRLLPRRTSHRRPCAPHCPGPHSRAPARRERLLAQPHPPRPRRRRGVLGLYL